VSSEEIGDLKVGITEEEKKEIAEEIVSSGSSSKNISSKEQIKKEETLKANGYTTKEALILAISNDL